MRAIVLLCMLHAAFGMEGYGWVDPSSTSSDTASNPCYLDQQSCGCCVMQKQLNRMEQYFNFSYEGMHHVLTESKMALNYFRESRSAFSVALNSNARMDCFGPFPDDKLIPFKHVFINLGDSYSTDTSIFTAPRSGVYSLAVTIYSDIDSPINPFAACANLMVNGHAVAVLPEHKGNDPEDSSTVVVAAGLKAGDQVGVLLPAGCVICDNLSHFNTFTGFLLHTTDS
ncbi:complement C1q-like protein 4 [Notothenia coriiceps]|uniref:Complement C1q-like protein 4 n=1 Tax=Notothenia coriiceps TaxID=8208 RepID=A0A6I9PMF4_9TELE|nr:PREDICTED: complement C1q-like protein 4 [Notothenia coriiceps]